MSDDNFNHQQAKDFYQLLKDEGLYVRDYEKGAREQMCLAMAHLLKVVTPMDENNRRDWKDVTVGVLLSSWCKALHLYYGSLNKP
jgi:hypothetical protein